MIQKYERKRYYVAPTDTMKAEAKTSNETAMNKQSTTRPLKTLLGEKAQNIVIGQNEEVNLVYEKTWQRFVYQ